jgi:hypothetical protein
LVTLSERQFVGTESWLLTLFEWLRQMSDGRETDAGGRVRELQRQRAEIDAEIERVEARDMPLLGNTAVKERFTQLANVARELLADCREMAVWG